MGRYYWDKKLETDGLRKLDISWLHQKGYVKEGGIESGVVSWSDNADPEPKSSVSIYVSTNADDRYLRLIYKQTDRRTGEKKDHDYKIPLTSTPCFFGGHRYWFQCPWYVNGTYCGRRVGTLYLGDKVFACRHCYNLSYASRNVTKGFLRKYPTFSYLELEVEVAKLRDQIKVPYYRNKPTRKQRRLMRLEQRMYDFGIAALRELRECDIL